MSKFKYIFTAMFLTASMSFAQNAIEDLQRGANILARQFYTQKKMHKAKTLAKFVTIIDKENPNNEFLIKTISDGRLLKPYQTLDDDGIAYSNFLLDLLKVLPDNPNTREKRVVGLYVCSVINPDSPAVKLLPRDIDFSNFYADLFESSPDMAINKIEADKVISETVIETLNYNPSELLDAFNTINYKIRSTTTQINILTERIKVDFVDDDNGYNIFNGPSVKATDKNVLFKDIKLIDFLRYVEHTTSLAFKANGYSIDVVDAVNGTGGRPEYIKATKSIMSEVQSSMIRSRSTYDNKTIQVKGTVTDIRDTGSKFLIQLDNLYVVFVDSSKLKDNSKELITQRFTEFAKAKKDGPISTVEKNRPYLELVVRGTCKIDKINRIFINNCTSILAEEIGTFYTK